MMYTHGISIRLFIWVIVGTVSAQDVFFDDPVGGILGRVCTTTNGGTGRCSEIKECIKVHKSLFLELPVHCGFNGNTPVVCCPVISDLTTEDPTNGVDISPPIFSRDFFCGTSATKIIDFPFLQRFRRARPFDGRLESAPRPDDPETPVIGGRDSRRNAWPWMALIGVKEDIPNFETIPGPGDKFKLSDTHGIESLPNFGDFSGAFESTSLLAASPDFDVRSGSLGGFLTDWFCGGVLINNQWVLTAAHCLTLREPKIVRLGEHDYHNSLDGANHQDFEILEMIRHPDYTFPVAYHDLALIKLKEKVRLQTFISPVCLPWGDETQRNLEGKTVKLTGWGDTQYAGNSSSILQEVDLTMFSTSKCDDSYSVLSRFRLNWPKGMGQETACAGDVRGGRDACQGDSGGPITYFNNGRYVVNGIVSTGYGCGNKNFPGIYANLQYPPHLDWIKKIAF